VTSVAVIGGGPAGSATAIRLARLGLPVTLYEKSHFPRRKLCGGFVSPEALQALSDLGVLQAVRDSAAYPIHRVTVAAAGSAVAKTDLPNPGLSVSRAALDAHLLAQARRVGVRVFEGTDGLRNTGHADWTVIATGRGARDGAAAGPSWYGFQALFRDVSGITDGIELDLFRGGYVGLARQEAAVNVCGLVSKERLRHAGPDIDRALRVFASENRTLAAHLAKATRTTPWAAVGPVVMGRRALSQGDLLFVGDAACVVDPFVGEGITMALYGSAVLAKAFETRAASLPSAYEQFWQDSFQAALPLGTLIRKAVGNRFSQDLLVGALQTFPGALRWITERTRSRVPL
jgi:flavin-dependent dehydrogenase